MYIGLGKYFDSFVTVIVAIYLDLYLSFFNVKVFVGMGCVSTFRCTGCYFVGSLCIRLHE